MAPSFCRWRGWGSIHSLGRFEPDRIKLWVDPSDVLESQTRLGNFRIRAGTMGCSTRVAPKCNVLLRPKGLSINGVAVVAPYGSMCVNPCPIMPYQWFKRIAVLSRRNAQFWQNFLCVCKMHSSSVWLRLCRAVSWFLCVFAFNSLDNHSCQIAADKRQNSFSLCVLRPMPNALALFIHFPNAVKGHAMNPALPVCKPEGLRVVFGEIQFSQRDDDDPALHAVKVAQLEVSTAKFGVPVDAV